MTASHHYRDDGRPIVAAVTHGGAPHATADDLLALARVAWLCDVAIEQVPWDSPTGSWDRYAAILVRSAWDYHLRLGEFLDWIGRIEASGPRLWNPAAVIRWNCDKRYLSEIARAGALVVPTEWMHRGDDVELHSVMRDHDWTEVVVKPSVAATSYRTERVPLSDAASSGVEAVARIRRDSDVMVQPFLPQICGEGEWSFVYFADGRSAPQFSHAVIKRPKGGDFRVQPQFGGSAQVMTPSPALRRQVDEVAATISELLNDAILYMRLDGVVGAGRHAPAGAFLLMEAELIEPMLFFGPAPGSCRRFARALSRRLI